MNSHLRPGDATGAYPTVKRPLLPRPECAAMRMRVAAGAAMLLWARC